MTARPWDMRPVRRVQIQVLSAHDAFGGGAKHARNLARGLRELGVRVSLLCTGAAAPVGDPDFDEIIAVQPRSVPLLWRWPPAGSLPFWWRVARRAARGVHAVIALSPVLAVATRWARRRVPLLYAPAVLDKVEHPGPGRRVYTWFETQALRCADRVLVRTEAVRAAIEAQYCLLDKPVGMALPGIDERHAGGATRTRAALGIPDEAKLLLTVGLVNENKGQRCIARALARAAREDWWWAIVGAGPDGPAIRAALGSSPIAARTVFVGPDRHVADWYAAADVLVAASRHETFGQAIAEALWSGLPVVIPRNEPGAALSPLAEHVERHGLGWSFSRGDVEELAEVLGAALRDEAVRQRLGRRAAAFARENFRWTNYADCALRLLESDADVVMPVVEPRVEHRGGVAHELSVTHRLSLTHGCHS